MPEQPQPKGSQGDSLGVLAIRYGIPALFIIAGQVVLITTQDPVNWAGFTGAGLAILLIGALVRMGTEGDRERDREEAARQYFDKHGRWPDDGH